MKEHARHGQRHQHRCFDRSTVDVTHEDDDLVDPVDEFWWEVGLNITHHKLPRLRPHRPVAHAHIVEIRRPEVAGHHDDGVAKVDNTTLAICEAAIVKNLEEQHDEFARRLLDLVDENDTVRLAPRIFCQLPTRLVPNIARRSTDESCDSVFPSNPSH